MIVDSAVYRVGRRVPGVDTPADACAVTERDSGTFVWVGIADPVGEGFQRIADDFGLPSLAVEDAIETHQRPKVEHYGDTLFVVLKPARYVDAQESVQIDEVQIFVHRRFIVTVRHGVATALADTRCRPTSRRHLPNLVTMDDAAPYGPTSTSCSQVPRSKKGSGGAWAAPWAWTL